MWVRKCSNGKIRYVDCYTDPITGKHREVSVVYSKDTKINRREAEKVLNEKIAQKCEPDVKNYTFGTLVDLYLADKKLNVKSSTYAKAEFVTYQIRDIIGADALMHKITTAYIKKRLIASGKSKTRINTYIMRIKNIYVWAFKNEIIGSKSVAERLEPFPETDKEKREKNFMESSELNYFIENIHVERWKLLTEFLALSGLRIGELVALDRKDVDLQEKVIRVYKTYDAKAGMIGTAKTEASVDTVIIQRQLEDCVRRINAYMLRQQLQNRYKTDVFFAGIDGGRINYYSYERYMRLNTRKILGRTLTPHSLRHTHASLLFEQGFTLDEVSRRLRHGDVTTTKEIYIHITNNLKKKDAERLQDVQLI